MENYYNVLGVAENATQDEIKKAFRNKSKEHHPDRGGNEEEFKKINEAYSAIGDEQKRAEYDNQRNNPFANMGGNPFGGGDPFDIFASMFGGGKLIVIPVMDKEGKGLPVMDAVEVGLYLK